MTILTTNSDGQPQVRVTKEGFVEVRFDEVTFLMSHILAEELAGSLTHAVSQVDEMRMR